MEPAANNENKSEFININELIYNAAFDKRYDVVDYLLKFPYDIDEVMDYFLEGTPRVKGFIYIAKKTGKYINDALGQALYIEDFKEANNLIKLGANNFDDYFEQILNTNYIDKGKIQIINFLLEQQITDYSLLFENEIINHVKIKKLNIDLVNKYFNEHKTNINIKRFVWINLLKKGLHIEHFYKNGQKQDIEFAKNIITQKHSAINETLKNSLLNDIISLICKYVTI